MKFWQKAFICVILCFLIGFDVTAYLIVNKNYEMSKANEIATAENEYFIIRKSLSDRLVSAARYYTSLNPDNVRQYAAPYAQYYEEQNIYIVLFKNSETIYSNFSGDLSQAFDMTVAPGGKWMRFCGIDSRQYLLIADYLNISEPDFFFVYIKDEQSLVEYWQAMTGHAVKIGTIVPVILSVLLIFMLLGLTRPIRKLNKTC